MDEQWNRLLQIAEQELSVVRLNAVGKRQAANTRKTNLDDEAAAVWEETQLMGLEKFIAHGKALTGCHNGFKEKPKENEDLPLPELEPYPQPSMTLNFGLRHMISQSTRKQLFAASRHLCRIWHGPIWQASSTNGPYCGFWMDDWVVTHSKTFPTKSHITISFHSDARHYENIVLNHVYENHPNRTIYNVTNPLMTDPDANQPAPENGSSVVAISLSATEKKDLVKMKETEIQQHEIKFASELLGFPPAYPQLNSMILYICLYYMGMDDSIQILPLEQEDLSKQWFWTGAYTSVMQGAPILRITPISWDVVGFVGKSHPTLQQIGILPVIPRKSLHFDWDRVRIRSYLIDIFGRGMDHILLEILAFSTLNLFFARGI
jgi:hypothetical protein